MENRLLIVIQISIGLAAILLGGCAPFDANRPPPVEQALWPTTFELDHTITDPLGKHPLLSMLRPSNNRYCKYNSPDDVVVEYYDKRFDLNRIKSVDFLICPFPGAPDLAHTMISFGFEGDEYLAVSVEIRKEKGESYDPIKGFLRQYEIMYVVADERDLIQLRTNHWQFELFLYPTRATPEAAREMFVDVMRRVNKLYLTPEFYDTLTNNCTTNIVRHVNRLSPEKIPLDYRVLMAGRSDRLAYDLGLLDTDTSFEATKARAGVNYLAYLHRNDADFSAKIRQR